MRSGQSKPALARLIYALPGRPPRTLDNNKPFGVMQTVKKQWIASGYDKNYLKITYAN